MTTVVTLAERERRRLAAAATAIASLDFALSAYARREDGRFIRFGSSATGPLRPGSDVDVIADFPDDRPAHSACRFVDETCFDLGLLPDRAGPRAGGGRRPVLMALLWDDIVSDVASAKRPFAEAVQLHRAPSSAVPGLCHQHEVPACDAGRLHLVRGREEASASPAERTAPDRTRMARRDGQVSGRPGCRKPSRFAFGTLRCMRTTISRRARPLFRSRPRQRSGPASTRRWPPSGP